LLSVTFRGYALIIRIQVLLIHPMITKPGIKPKELIPSHNPP
jgi:hypothetical protein